MPTPSHFLIIPLSFYMLHNLTPQPAYGCMGGGKNKTNATGAPAYDNINKYDMDFTNYTPILSGDADWDNWNPAGDPSLHNFFTELETVGGSSPTTWGDEDDSWVPSGGDDEDEQWGSPVWSGGGGAGGGGGGGGGGAGGTGVGGGGPGGGTWGKESAGAGNIADGPNSKPGWQQGSFQPGVKGGPGAGENEDPKLKGIPNFSDKYGAPQPQAPPPHSAYLYAQGKPNFCNIVDEQNCGDNPGKTAWRYQPDKDECEQFTYCGVGFNAFRLQDLCEEACVGAYESSCDPEHLLIDEDIVG